MGNGVVMFANIIREFFDGFDEWVQRWRNINTVGDMLVRHYDDKGNFYFEHDESFENECKYLANAPRAILLTVKDNCKEALKLIELETAKGYKGKGIKATQYLECKKFKSYLKRLIGEADKGLKTWSTGKELAHITNIKTMIEAFADDVFESETLKACKA
jgi:hypothetical protein